MSESADPQRRQRRRRRRAAAPAGPPPVADRATPPATSASPVSTSAGSRAARSADRPRRRQDEERGLHDLAGSGPSRLGVSGALRARDLNRPNEADLEAAEREIVLVRRHWQPPS